MCWQVCPFDSVPPSKSTSATWRCCKGPTSWNTKTSEAAIHVPERRCCIDPTIYAVPSPIWILPLTFIYTIYVKGEWRGKGFHCEKWPETDRTVILPLIVVFAFHFIPCAHTIKEIVNVEEEELSANDGEWSLHQTDHLCVNVLTQKRLCCVELWVKWCYSYGSTRRRLWTVSSHCLLEYLLLGQFIRHTDKYEARVSSCELIQMSSKCWKSQTHHKSTEPDSWLIMPPVAADYGLCFRRLRNTEI